MDNQYILVVGCTGVGKSTTSNFLHYQFKNSVVYSDPYNDNPFIEQSYVQNDNKSFQSEIFFIKEFLKIHKAINNIDNQWIFQERSIYECVHIFCRLFLIQKKINQDEYRLCVDLLNELSSSLKLPDKIVYLTANAAVIEKRIIARSRPFEKSIDIDFIKTQQRLYEDWLNQYEHNYNIPILRIDNSDSDILTTNKNILAKIQNY